MKKLINMTDFVLERNNNSLTPLKDIVNYANFLKQPLELWMFVPCDDNGNVLEKPKTKDFYKDEELQEAIKEYQQGKEKCLFEGFWLDETYKMNNRQLPYLTNGKNSVFLHSDFAIRHKFIECLIDENIELTQTAQKQLGL